MLQDIKATVRHSWLVASGRVAHLTPSVKIEKVWRGNLYGGFYVHPAVLNERSIVYSVGVGEDISFDRDMILNYGCEVFAFDPTPKSIDWLKADAASVPDRFNFFPFGIGETTKTATFFLPKNVQHVSGSFVQQAKVDGDRAIEVQLKSFSDMVGQCGHTKVDVLKMDIEGGEYAVLDSVLSCDVKPAQILLEFHDRFFSDGKSRSKKLLSRRNRM